MATYARDAKTSNEANTWAISQMSEIRDYFATVCP